MFFTRAGNICLNILDYLKKGVVPTNLPQSCMHHGVKDSLISKKHCNMSGQSEFISRHSI